ncbi:MAG: GumC family protein [Nodosilinea sp.]
METPIEVYQPEDIDFQKYWLILKRHRLPAGLVLLASLLAASFFAFTQEKQYEASGKIRLNRQNTTSSLVTEGGGKVGQLDSLSLDNTPLDTEVEIIRSAPTINQTIEILGLADEDGELIEYNDFLKNLTVDDISGTDIFQVSYKSPNPDEAEQVVNQLMETYIESNAASNRIQVSAAKEFINSQLPRTETVLKQSENALRDFRESNRIVDLEAEAQLTAAQIGQTESREEDARRLLQKTTAQINELQEKLGERSEVGLATSQLNNSVAIQSVYTQLKEVENQLATESSRYTDQHPVILNLKNEKASLEALLEQRITELIGSQEGSPTGVFEVGNIQDDLLVNLVGYEIERKGLVQELEALGNTKQFYQQRASTIPKLQQQERTLERQLNVNQTAYESLLNNLQQARIIENQNLGNAQIVSAAVESPDPITGSKKLYLAAGLVLGSMLYVLTAFALDLRDPTLKLVKEIRGIFPYTLLGMIPNYQQKSMVGFRPSSQNEHEIIALTLPNSPIGQAYKMLQANLGFIRPDRQPKSIVVTSSLPEEGKSSVSSNLAAVIAQLNSRVLLIDADLHHPQQHHIWRLTNKIGLSEVIMNQAESSQAIQSVIANLDVLTAGAVPPNSLALLGSQKLSELIQTWQQQYDFLIFDTPPMSLLADAVTLSKRTDGILLVSRPGVLDQSSANASRELLKQSGQDVLGLVINGFVIEDEPDSHFHHAQAYSNSDYDAGAGAVVVPARIQNFHE